VDQWRIKRESALRANPDEFNPNLEQVQVNFEGHGVLIVAKNTTKDETPLCLGIGETGNRLQLVPVSSHLL
jgi:hypothetical protein